MDPANKKVLVLGGTGHYGQNITRELVRLGADVRVLTRHAGNAEKLFGDKVEIVSGDIEDRQALERAFTDVGRIVYAISAMSIGQIRRCREIEQDAVIASLRLAEKMAIERIVYLSVFEIDREFARKNRLATAREKAAVEDFIAGSSFNWTVLGAPPSMEIFFSMIRGNRMIVPGGGPKGLPTVSAADVGEIAAQTLLRDDLSGQRIQMVAAQAYSFREAAARISAVWGAPITFVKIPMFFSRIAYYVSAPFSLFSDRSLYVHTLLGFVRLLKKFPESYAEKVPALHEKLKSLFLYSPSRLEMEAERRRPAKR
jgi:uncharacterized protein YbjT (DUF2867 family)